MTTESNTQQAAEPATLTTPAKPTTHSTAIIVVLQWLTYAFWFWTLTVIAIVLSSAIAYHVVEKFDGEWLVYVSSSLIVLLPVALAADYFFRKVEPEKKHGFAAVIMVINAVIACLVAVGSLITVVVTLVSLVVGTGDTTGKAVTIIASTVVALLAFLFFLRIVKINSLSFITNHFGKIVSGVVLITLLLAAFGPMVDSAKRKGDRLIEDNYYNLRRDIEAYARDNDRLPDSLGDVELSDESEKIVATGRITYEPGEQKNNSNSGSSSYRYINSQWTYEICVDWEFEKNGYESEYQDSYYGGAHKQGNQCYEELIYIN